ncbi:UrcA family protein [Allosphingosinicella sp.]|uniref:UrcA family protein n=1 Tax=Allosphingosinicella sp. TaxID=2823234 RepID=UPI002F23A067
MKTIALAALFAAGLFAAPASAQSGGHAIAVSPAGLDLASAEGRAQLDLRLLRAARSACGTPSPLDLRGQARLDSCIAEVLADIAPQRQAAIARAERRVGSTLASSR